MIELKMDIMDPYHFHFYYYDDPAYKKSWTFGIIEYGVAFNIHYWIFIQEVKKILPDWLKGSKS